MNASILTFGTCFLSATTALLPGSALAQTQQATAAGTQTRSDTTADIVVTAQRRSESIQSVPASINAVSGETLATRQIKTMSEALAQVPNVSVDQPYGDGGPPNYTIRGVTATDFSLNQSKPIAIYLNESPRDFQLFEVQPLYDIERVEVLSGPQGTLYGRNATGGAVSIITKPPEFNNSGYLTAGYGSFQTRRAEGAANLKLADKVALRLAFFYTDDNGVFKNLRPGVGSSSQTNILSLRGSLRAEPTDNLEMNLRVGHTLSRGRDFLPYPSSLDVSRFPASIQAVTGVDRAGVGFNENQSDDPGLHRINTNSINLQLKWEPSSSYSLMSISSYDWGSMLDDSDEDGLPIEWFNVVSASKNSQAVQEVRVLSNYKGIVNWQGGASVYQDEINSYYGYSIGTDPRCTDPECYGGFGGVGFVTHNSYLQRRHGVSGYVRVDLTPLPGVTLHGGIRQSHDVLQGLNYTAMLGDSVVPNAVATIPSSALGDQFNNTSLEGGADWKITSRIMVYGSYKQGYRMGALNGQALAADQLSIAQPELARAFEVGFKSDLFNHMLTLNLSLSRTRYEHQQIVSLVPGILAPQLESMPSTRIDALEMETVFRPVGGVSLSGTLGLLDAKYTANLPFLEVDGNYLPNAPTISATLGASADLLKVESGKLDARVDARYKSRQYFDDLNNQDISQGKLWLVDANIGWDAAHYSIRGGVKNIFDEKYYTSGLEFSSFLPFNYQIRGLPRRFSIEATYRF